MIMNSKSDLSMGTRALAESTLWGVQFEFWGEYENKEEKNGGWRGGSWSLALRRWRWWLVNQVDGRTHATQFYITRKTVEVFRAIRQVCLVTRCIWNSRHAIDFPSDLGADTIFLGIPTISWFTSRLRNGQMKLNHVHKILFKNFIILNIFNYI